MTLTCTAGIFWCDLNCGRVATEWKTLPASSCLLLLTFHSLTCFPSAPISCLLLDLDVSLPLSPDHWIQCRIGLRGVSSREQKGDVFLMKNPMVILQLNSVCLILSASLPGRPTNLDFCTVSLTVLCDKCLGTSLLKKKKKKTHQNPTKNQPTKPNSKIPQNPSNTNKKTNSKIPQKNCPHPHNKKPPQAPKILQCSKYNFSLTIYSSGRHEYFSSFGAIN